MLMVVPGPVTMSLLLNDVEGWLDQRTASITRFLTHYQHGRDMIGDVLEIGVYHGKYFLVLVGNLAALERAVAIDIFGSQDPKIPSVQGSREVFEATIKKYAPHVQPIVMESDSTRLSTEDILGAMGEARSWVAPFRFISIDGSHDAESVYRDLHLCRHLMMPGAIIALDDWTPEGNKQWPGVAEGEARYQQEHPEDLYHIGAIPNKLLLTNDPQWVDDYRSVLRDFGKRFV